MRVRLPPSAPKKQLFLVRGAVVFYFRGSRTLRGQRTLRKRLIIVFRAVVRRPVPKCVSIWVVKQYRCEAYVSRHRHQKKQLFLVRGMVVFYFKSKLCISGPEPAPKSSSARSASDTYFFAFFTDPDMENPLARFAEIALDKVHPVP